MDSKQTEYFDLKKDVAKQVRSGLVNPRGFIASTNPTPVGDSTVICQVVDPAKYGVNILPTNSCLVRLLVGPNLDPVDEFLFQAANASGITFSIGAKVFVLYGSAYTPFIVSGFGSTGGGTGLFKIHGHFGWGDGGFANFTSGSY